MLAATADGHAVTTVEGLTEPDGTLGRVQQAFGCPDCSAASPPGFLTTVTTAHGQS
jgi:carbon-monoxide dehydrogenase small subunit